MALCLQQDNQKSPTSILDLNVPGIMSDTDTAAAATAAAGNDEDSIKAAVRDAAKKTQDRMAAYQQKQAAKAAAAAAMDESQKAPSKAKQEAENTVSRLQQLVSESKRLTTKSRELNTQLPNVAVAAAAQDGSAASAKASSAAGGPGFHRSNTIGDPITSRRQAAATASMDNSMNSSMRVTPKGKKLSEIFQTLGAGGGGNTNNSMSQSVNDHHSHSNLMERDNSVKSLMPTVESTMTQSNLAQWQHKREQQQKSAEQDNQKSKSKRGSQKDDDSDGTASDDSSVTMDVDIDDDDDDDIDSDESGSGSESDHGNNSKKKKKGTKPQQEQQPEDNGAFSILSMVQKKKKETEGREEVESMIQEYYSTPAAAGATEQQDEEPDMPGLDKILETPTATKPKWNRSMSTGSNKKKRMPTRPQTKQEKAAATAPASQAEDNLEEDMPILAPFDTPKASKPKFGTQAALSQQQKDKNDEDGIPGMEKSMSQEEAESSLNLSMVFHKSSAKMDAASSPQKSPQNDKSPQGARSESPQPPPQAAAPLKSALRRQSMEPSPSPPPTSSQAPLNLSKLPLIGDNPKSRVTPENDDVDNDDDNKSTVSSSPRHRRSTRTGRGRDDNSSQRSMRSRSSRSKSRTRGVSRRASFKGGSKGGKGDNVSLSILDKYHKKAAEGSVQSFPDEVSVEKDPINNNDDTNKKTGLDVSELSRSSESTRSSDSDGGGIGMSRSMGDSSAESVDSSRTSGSRRRGRSNSNDNSTRSKRDPGRSRSRSRTRDVGKPAPPSRSVSRSASSRRGGRRQKLSSQNDNIDGSMRDMSMSGSSRRSSSRINKDGNSSLRDMNASARDSGSSRRRRSISTRRGAGRRGQRRSGSGEYEDETEASTADEILGSLDVSDIKIVGDGDDEDEMDSSIIDDSNRASIYDRKQKRASVKSGSLAGLSKLQPGGQGGADDFEGSVSESVKSSATTASKKSMMGKFARKVGRKLTMQGSKKKKTDDDEEDEDEDGTEAEEPLADLELQALAAEFEEEERQIEAAGSSEAPDMDLSKREQSRENGKTEVVDSPDFQKTKKKRQSTVFGAIKKVGSKITKKKKKKLKDTEALESDSDSDDNDIPSGGTLDRPHSDSEEDDDQGGGDFAQLQINGDKATIAMCGSDREEAVRTAQPKGRQRRSTVSRRRQRADRQRTQSLQAVLGSTAENAAGDEDMDASVVTTDTQTRVRRAQSVRGRIQRTRASEVEVKRHKSVKGRMENNSERPTSGRRLRRAKSNEEDPPPFDWKAYSAEKPAKKNKEKRKPKADKVDNKRMSGGLSAVIYHGQAVAS